MTDIDIRTVNDLRYAYRQHHPKGRFFDDDVLRFFGERFSEMRVLKDKVTIKSPTGQTHVCYVLSTVQRVEGSRPKRHYVYFDDQTFEDIEPVTPIT